MILGVLYISLGKLGMALATFRRAFVLRRDIAKQNGRNDDDSVVEAKAWVEQLDPEDAAKLDVLKSKMYLNLRKSPDPSRLLQPPSLKATTLMKLKRMMPQTLSYSIHCLHPTLVGLSLLPWYYLKVAWSLRKERLFVLEMWRVRQVMGQRLLLLLIGPLTSIVILLLRDLRRSPEVPNPSLPPT
jgi:hypothetical protein